MNGEPRTSTSTFTQLLTSDPDDCSVLLYVHAHRAQKEDRTITNYTHSLIVVDTFFLRARIDYISSAFVFAFSSSANGQVFRPGPSDRSALLVRLAPALLVRLAPALPVRLAPALPVRLAPALVVRLAPAGLLGWPQLACYAGPSIAC